MTIVAYLTGHIIGFYVQVYPHTLKKGGLIAENNDIFRELPVTAFEGTGQEKESYSV